MKTGGRLGSYVVALATVATLTVVLLSQREVFTIANVTMFFLLGVVLVAVTRGTGFCGGVSQLCLHQLFLFATLLFAAGG
jgi:K+-sensing histidine kinase KdpD